VKPQEHVLLHVTGGGREIQYSEQRIFQARPTLRVRPDELDAVLSAIGMPAPVASIAISRALCTYEAPTFVSAKT
jgi:hypothetical protein